jgi:hypothetical protein
VSSRIPHRRAFQFGLKAAMSMITLAATVFWINTCPPPTGPLLMKAAGGIVLFLPVLVAVYFADWFERR